MKLVINIWFSIRSIIKSCRAYVSAGLFKYIDMIQSPKKIFKSLHGVSLYRNSFYLMVSSAIQGATGFIFWMVAARLYSTETVGLGSAMIASIGLLGMLSTLGLDFALVRFRPNMGDNASTMINSSFTISVLSSIAMALIYIAGLHIWSSPLVVIHGNTMLAVLFVFSVITTSLMSLARQVFVAQRKAAFTVIQGLLFGVIRFIPLVVLASYSQNLGIVASWAVSLLFAIVLGMTILIPRVEARYSVYPAVDTKLLGQMLKFSLSNYMANVLSLLPQFVLPLIVINVVGETQNAYFYMALSVANLLFVMPSSIALSLFAEGSYKSHNLKSEILKSLKLVGAIVLPFMLLVIFAAGNILHFFGPDYAANAKVLLVLLAISVLPLSINNIYFSIERVRMRMKKVVEFNLLVTALSLGLPFLFLPRFGIVSVGLSLIISNGIIAPYSMIRIFRELK